MSIQDLEKTIEKYGRDIFSFCVYLTGDWIMAEELYQDIFVTALEHLEDMRAEEGIKNYFLSIAVRLWQNKRRKIAWRRRIAPMQFYDEDFDRESESENNIEADILDRYISGEEQECVRQAVHKLKENLRIPVILYYVNEMTVPQIARILGIPEGTVKSRLSTARKRLKKELEDSIHDK